MLKFKSKNDTGFRVIFDALLRYSSSATKVIDSRWVQEKKFIGAERQKQAEDLLHEQEPLSPDEDTNKVHSNELFFLPRCSKPQFTGRKVYADMVKESFKSLQKGKERGQNKIFVIYGLGGSGKTEFCLRYAENNQESYWAVFWVDASTRENAEAAFALLGQFVGKGATFSAGKHWLSQCSKSWLMIIDNADDPEMEVSDYFPPGGNGHILITTKNPNKRMLATVGNTRFRGMDPEEAIGLLLKLAYPEYEAQESNDQKRELAGKVAAELDYLALALTQAGTTIRRKIYSLDTYLHFYLGTRTRLLPKSIGGSVDEANVITTWEIPFQKIEHRESREHKDAVDLMHIFAFMHFDSIYESFFRRSAIALEGFQLGTMTCPDIIRDSASHSEEAQARFRRAIGILCDYSLVDHEPARKTCSLHPVVHRWARNRLTVEKQKVWLLCTVAFLASCISPHQEASGFDFRRHLIPHLDSCLRHLKSHNVTSPTTVQNANAIERFAWVYAENGLWKTAVTLQVQVIDYRTRILGRTHGDTIKAVSSLGQTYWNLFEVGSAIKMQFQVLRRQWRSRPSFLDWAVWPPWYPDHVSYCITLVDLTAALWLAGEREYSKRTGERAIHGLLRRLGPDDPKTLNCMFNLARTYAHLGELKKSQDLLVLVLKKQKMFFGPDHPDTLMTRNELGAVYCAGGYRLAVAERLVTNVLEARKRVLGEEHAYTLWSVNELSKILCERNRPAEAAKMLEDVVDIVTRTLGERHSGMLMTKANIARAYALCGRWQDSEVLIRNMLDDMKEDHPNYVETKSGYLRVLIKLDRQAEAEKISNHLLDIIMQVKSNPVLDFILRKNMLARDGSRTVWIAEQLAQIYRRTGRAAEVANLKTRFPKMDESNLDEPYYQVQRGKKK